MIIDPPSPFAPLLEWVKFLKELEKLTPANAQEASQITEAVKLAERELRRKAGLD